MFRVKISGWIFSLSNRFIVSFISFSQKIHIKIIFSHKNHEGCWYLVLLCYLMLCKRVAEMSLRFFLWFDSSFYRRATVILWTAPSEGFFMSILLMYAYWAYRLVGSFSIIFFNPSHCCWMVRSSSSSLLW